MTAAKQLVCLRPDAQPQLALQTTLLREPRHGEVLLRTQATSVNPIDVKRSAGYGSRLLGLKGAARFPLVLGNDVAGVVQAVGAGVSTWKPGDHVYGLLPTGSHGAHASHVLVNAGLLRASPPNRTPASLAALPYTFTTLWLALQRLGLDPATATGRQVLVHGASGGLGQLALQVLVRWGARVTAVCSTPHVLTCQRLGAYEVFDRRLHPLWALPRRFDASLNFASWPDEAMLISRLQPDALGHATTVHPLLASFDEGGWVRGSVRAYQAWSGMRRQLAASSPHARYAWVVFQPSTSALDALHDWITRTGMQLPLGLSAPLSEGQSAFMHVAQQRAGRAILLPE